MKTKRSDHITLKLKFLHWLLISYKIDLKALLLVYKPLNVFQQSTPATPLRSLQRNMLVKPTVRTKHGEVAFSCCAARL